MSLYTDNRIIHIWRTLWQNYVPSISIMALPNIHFMHLFLFCLSLNVLFSGVQRADHVGHHEAQSPLLSILYSFFFQAFTGLIMSAIMEHSHLFCLSFIRSFFRRSGGWSCRPSWSVVTSSVYPLFVLFSGVQRADHVGHHEAQSPLLSILYSFFFQAFSGLIMSAIMKHSHLFCLSFIRSFFIRSAGWSFRPSWSTVTSSVYPLFVLFSSVQRADHFGHHEA